MKITDVKVTVLGMAGHSTNALHPEREELGHTLYAYGTGENYHRRRY